jgi:hypothetical protein
VEHGSEQDTLASLWELKKADSINGPGSDSLTHIELTSAAVSWKEHRIGNELRIINTKIVK